MSNRKLLVDGSRGIYVPKVFSEQFMLEGWIKPEGVTYEEIQDYLSNPETEHYWEYWGYVLENAEHIDEDGVKWRLEQDDGDLFAVECEVEEG